MVLVSLVDTVVNLVDMETSHTGTETSHMDTASLIEMEVEAVVAALDPGTERRAQMISVTGSGRCGMDLVQALSPDPTQDPTRDINRALSQIIASNLDAAPVDLVHLRVLM